MSKKDPKKCHETLPLSLVFSVTDVSLSKPKTGETVPLFPRCLYMAKFIIVFYIYVTVHRTGTLPNLQEAMALIYLTIRIYAASRIEGQEIL